MKISGMVVALLSGINQESRLPQGVDMFQNKPSTYRFQARFLLVSGVRCTSLQCRRILDTRVHIFVLGRHIGFGNFGGLGRGNISRGSRRQVEKNEALRLCTNPLQAEHSRWQHRKLDLLSSTPLQNNACTAGYALLALGLQQVDLISRATQSRGRARGTYVAKGRPFQGETKNYWKGLLESLCQRWLFS